MSEAKKETKETREKYKFEPAEYPDFPAIASTAYLSSNDLCKLVAEVFKSVFADFEGCLFDMPTQSPQGDREPTVSLLFNHGQYPEDAAVACERAAGKTTGSSVIDTNRRRDFQMTYGDRYYLTEDGIDIIKPLLVAWKFNNGNPNWKNIVSEWQDRNAGNIWNQGKIPQYTRVSSIDIRKLCAMIFGSENGEDIIAYDFAIASALNPTAFYGPNMSSMMNMGINSNYMLMITKVSQNELYRTYEKIGFGNMGAHIVRG